MKPECKKLSRKWYKIKGKQPRAVHMALWPWRLWVSCPVKSFKWIYLWRGGAGAGSGSSGFTFLKDCWVVSRVESKGTSVKRLQSGWSDRGHSYWPTVTNQDGSRGDRKSGARLGIQSVTESKVSLCRVTNGEQSGMAPTPAGEMLTNMNWDGEDSGMSWMTSGVGPGTLANWSSWGAEGPPDICSEVPKMVSLREWLPWCLPLFLPLASSAPLLGAISKQGSLPLPLTSLLKSFYLHFPQPLLPLIPALIQPLCLPSTFLLFKALVHCPLPCSLLSPHQLRLEPC